LPSLYVFDAYGTLFDTSAAVSRHAAHLGEEGKRLAEIWRRKQLEYSWIRSLMKDRGRDFWQLTEDALDFALAKVPAAERSMRDGLLEAYRDLDTFEEVPRVLRTLKDGGARLAILSNGSHAMLERAIRSAKLETLIDRVFSAEDAGTFKTAPEIYELATTAFRLYPSAVSFQSSNRWDIAGAAKFGFSTVWINRSGEPDEYRDLPPAAILPDLTGLTTLG
jgi:2-haloacid dehalogenase